MMKNFITLVIFWIMGTFAPPGSFSAFYCCIIASHFAIKLLEGNNKA